MKRLFATLIALGGAAFASNAIAYTIAGTVMCDANASGTFDAGDTALDSKTVSITPESGSALTTLSGTGPDGPGSYKIDGNDGLNAGTWVVTVEVDPGANIVVPAGGSYELVLNQDNAFLTGIDFLIDDPVCRASFCGDGILDDGEQCDDGNDIDGDGCSAQCNIESFCGDGILDPGEQCDDGNVLNGDGCSAICTLESGGEGCTPGYWRQEHHFDSYPAPYAADTPFVTAFGVDAFPGQTLSEVATAKGGGLNALGRHAVAALLNAASADVDYDRSVSSVIDSFASAYDGSRQAQEYLKDVFENFNEQSCPLN